MADAGSRVDWGDNGRWIQASRKLSGNGSFSSLLSRSKAPKSGKNNNKDTGSVTRGGGSASQSTAAGLSGLKVTRVDRKVNTAKNKTTQVTSGGGHTSRANIQAKPSSVKVRPEA